MGFINGDLERERGLVFGFFAQSYERDVHAPSSLKPKTKYRIKDRLSIII